TGGLDQRLGLPPDLSPLGAQAGGQLDGLDQAGLVGHTLAGDVEGGPVVDGGADDGETYGDVNTLIEVEALEDRVALVVVHGDDEAVASLGGPGEGDVGRERPVNGDPRRAGLLHRGPDGHLLLVAEEAPFARVGVQAGNGDGRFLLAQGFGQQVGETDLGQDPFFGDPLDGFPEADVGGHVEDE